MKFGYSYTINDKNIQEPLCLLCNKVWHNSAMAPPGLWQHFESSHRNSLVDAVEIKVKSFEKVSFGLFIFL